MTPLTVEGTWDEVARHAQDFLGKRVRVTVIEDAEPPHLDQALAGLLAEADRLHAEQGQGSGADDPGSWGEAVAEKFRGQGFEL